MQFQAIDKEDIPKVSKRESAASTELFNAFLESDAEVAKVTLGEGDKKLASVRSSLQNYIKRHNLPVRVFTRGDELFLERTASVTA